MAAAQRDVRFFRLCGVKRVIGAPLTEAMQANFFGEDPGSAAAKARLFAGSWRSEAARLARCIAELGDAQLGTAGELVSGADGGGATARRPRPSETQVLGDTACGGECGDQGAGEGLGAGELAGAVAAGGAAGAGRGSGAAGRAGRG